MASIGKGQNCFTINSKDQMQDSFKLLDQMRRDRILCDVALVAKNVEISAHKNVLASCSQYFLTIFTNEHEKKEIIELDVNPEVLLSVINYMYTSTLTMQKDNVKEVFKIALILSMEVIQKECYKILEQAMDPNSCLGIKVVADTYEYPKLLATTLTYIDNHFVDVVKSQEFLDLSNDQLTELISRDTLRPSSEEEIYECVLRWINHDSRGRHKYLGSLMEHVRLPFISTTYLKKYIGKNSLVMGDTHCKDLLLNAFLNDDCEECPKIKSRQYRERSKILIAVGGTANEAMNNLEYYDFDQEKWSNIMEMPFGISCASIAAVKDKVYVLGGSRSGTISHEVNVFDVNSNSWASTVNMTSARTLHGVVVLSSYIYSIGGRDRKEGLPLNSGEKFDLATQKWTPITPMHTRREVLGVAVLDGIIYAVGGYDGTRALQSIECYNKRTGLWKNLSGMKECRSAFGVCAMLGKIYAIGGWTQETGYRETVEEYDPNTDIWTQIEPMNVARADIAVAVVDNRIYVVGGRNRNMEILTSVEVYDKVTNKWTILPQKMNISRRFHGVTVAEILQKL